MKKKLALVLALVMALLLVFSGCKAPGGEDPVEDPNSSQGENTVRTDMNLQLFTDPTSLDPQMVTSSYEGSVTMQIYDCLFEAPDGNLDNLQNSLCESYEVNESATEYILHIRQNVPFHNGDILTAEDVAFTLNRLVTSPVTATTYGGIAGAEVVDEYTVRVVCNYPVYRLPSMLSYYPSGIVNKKLVEQYGDSAIETIVGTGAYQLKEWTPGYGGVLVAFNEGWRGAPKIQQLNCTVILDANAALVAFQNKSLDMYYATSEADLELLSNNPDFTSMPYSTDTEDHLVFNTARAWCDNVKFRQAVAHAIDREALLEICAGGVWSLAESVVAPGNIAYRDGMKFPYEYDVEKAKQLLAESGYDGSEVGLLYTAASPVSNTWGTTVEAYLRAIGINVRMEGYDYATVVNKVVGRDYDMCLFEYAVNYADPLSSYYAMYRSDGFYNVWQVYSEEMDNRILAMYTMNDEQLAAETQAIDAWAQEQCLYIPCLQQGGYCFRPANLKTTSAPEPMFALERFCYFWWE